MKSRKCVYVVGAGFSAGLGYPLTSDLLFRLWSRLDNPKFKFDLQRIIQFHNPGFDPGKFTTFPNVELLMSQMLVNHQLFQASREHQTNFSKAQLEGIQKDLLLEIASWFHSISSKKNTSSVSNKWLLNFKNLITDENAAIISFNWDLEIDRLIYGKNINQDSYGLGNDDNIPILLKPHGSLNWFENDLGKHLKDRKKVKIYPSTRTSETVYAFTEYRAPISSADRVYSPLIIPPVFSKDFNKRIFKRLWQRCTSVLSTARKIVFLGYSMPESDLHARFIIRCGFHNQIEGIPSQRKTRKTNTGACEVVIVNPDRNAAERIASAVGTRKLCTWVSSPIAEWIRMVSK